MSETVRVEKQAESIYRIRIEVPFGVESVSLYLLDFPPLVLIDAGPRMPGLFKSILNSIKSAGLDPERIEALIITHGHTDHHGLASRFKELGAKVLIHAEDVKRLNHEPRFIEEEFSYYAELFERLGIPQESVSDFNEVMERFREFALPCGCDKELEGGEVFEGRNLTARIWHCPGHSAGHIAIEIPEEKILITGDHLLPEITPNPELYYPPRGKRISGLPDYIESLELIRSLEGRVALPGHGEPFADPTDRVREVIFHHEERARRVKELMDSGACGLWEITFEMFREEIKTGGSLQAFLALKEVLGHLEILKERGKIKGIPGLDIQEPNRGID
ncbi:MAG: MBL fold metallo-hydrolase [Actinomycetota bacterium]|nr:MBL fold metallo-hydrolase [Actinomycetota bacterium]